MSTQDVGSLAEPSLPQGSETFPVSVGDEALPRSTGRRTGAVAVDPDRRWGRTKTAGAGLVDGPWGLRPLIAPVRDYPVGRFTSVLRGVDRLALSLVYFAVLGGLPLVVVAFLVNGA